MELFLEGKLPSIPFLAAGDVSAHLLDLKPNGLNLLHINLNIAQEYRLLTSRIYN